MINYTVTITKEKEIDEECLFDNVKDYLLQEHVGEDYTTLENLPKDVQRLVFAKVGAMLIDYAGSEDF